LKRKLRMSVRYPLVWLVVIWCLVLGITFHATAIRKDSSLTPYTKTVFDNGLTVVVKEVHSAPIVAVDIWVGAGARNEPPELAGISHFIEHMLFKGTKKRKVGEISKAIQSVGGYLNAATSLDYTHYYVAVPSEYSKMALEVESDAILNSVFEPREIERERKVILEEMSLKHDDPMRNIGWLTCQNVFKGTPYGNDVLGTPETLASFTRETFIKYHRKYYVPNNMVVTVVGDINTDTVIRQLKELFKKAKPAELQGVPEFEIPVLSQVNQVQATMQVDQNYFYLGFPAPSQYSGDAPALTVLSVILGGGQSSRLYRDLREEKKLVNTVSAGYQAYHQIGMFAIYAQAQKLDPAEFQQEINRTLKELIEQGVTQAELTRAKSILRSQLAYATETDVDIAALLGEYELNGSAEDALVFEEALQNVTKEDIRRVAGKYLDPTGYVMTVVRP
jgi:zinc protease